MDLKECQNPEVEKEKQEKIFFFRLSMSGYAVRFNTKD